MRGMDAETRYKEWIGKVTENAVEKAFLLQSTSLVTDGLETGGGDIEQHRLATFIGSPLSRRTFVRSKGWDFKVSSLDRSNMTASIYALLLQWKPDNSVQWTSKVATTVPIFEEALYQKARSVEEYKNMVLLDVHLRQVLRQFEKGNGLSFFCQKPAETCPVIGWSEEHERFLVAKAKSVRTRAVVQNRFGILSRAKQIGNRTQTGNESFMDEGKIQNLPEPVCFKENQMSMRQRQELIKKEANQALWEAICTGNLKEMEEMLNKFQNCASKKLLKRITALISLKKQENLLINKLVMKEGSEELVTEKIKSSPSESEETCEEKSIPQKNHDDLQHVLTGRSRNGEICSIMEARNPATRMSCIVEGVSLGNSSAEDSACASQVESKFNAMSLECVQPSNCDANFTNLDAQVDSNVKSLEEHDPQHTQEGSDVCVRISEALDGFPMCSEMPVTHTADLRNSELSQHAEVLCSPVLSRGAFDQSASETSSNCNNLSESRSPQDQKHQDLMPLGSLFQLDDDEELAYFPQADLPAFHWTPIRSPSADSSEDQQQRNVCQVGRDRISHTGSGIIGDAVLRMQTDSVRVSLFSLLREGDNIDERVSLMSLLDERDDYKLLIFDQDMLASIKNRSLSQNGDNDLSESHTVCCVCMAGPRGAAFVPCGHTFCRKCAYDLQLSRGACPLCNRGIRQILKLY